MRATVDLAADVGESFGPYRMGDDEALLEIVTSANVACGFHAGDPQVMDETVAACARREVAVGAHPGFPDLAGFGRRSLGLTAHEVTTHVLYQLGALNAFARAHSTQLRHVTPHGALGNRAMTEPAYARALVEAVARFDPSLAIVTLEGVLADAARSAGLVVAILGIADRAYQDDGTLVPRSQPDAVITDEEAVAARAVRMVTEGAVASIGGRDVPVACDTVLVHGDTDGAIGIARRIRAELHRAGVSVSSLHEALAGRGTP